MRDHHRFWLASLLALYGLALAAWHDYRHEFRRVFNGGKPASLGAAKWLTIGGGAPQQAADTDAPRQLTAAGLGAGQSACVHVIAYDRLQNATPDEQACAQVLPPPPMPSPPPGLRLRDRAPRGPLIPVEPHRDQSLVHHIRTDMPPGTVHPLLDLVHKRIDQPHPPHRARHHQPPIPTPHMVAHRLRITPGQRRGRVRTPGQIERLKNLHHFPAILLHRSLHEPRVQRQPGVHRRRDHP